MVAVVYGIECRGCSPQLLRTIRTVLGRIRARHSGDWYRLRRRILYFEATDLDNAVGQWFPDLSQGGIAVKNWLVGGPGIVRFNKATAISVGTVAHECGHAATTDREFMARDGLDEEWTSELCANRYVAKWGFATRRWQRYVRHQFGDMAGIPGNKITVEGHGGDGDLTLVVTKDFRLRRVKPR